MGNEAEIKRPKVGTGIFILNDKNQVLFQKRTGGYGADTWGLPGGHLELYESFLENAIREIKEETDLDVESVEVLGVTNDIEKEKQNHYAFNFYESNKMERSSKNNGT